jgi:hypothetical protein
MHCVVSFWCEAYLVDLLLQCRDVAAVETCQALKALYTQQISLVTERCHVLYKHRWFRWYCSPENPLRRPRGASDPDDVPSDTIPSIKGVLGAAVMAPVFADSVATGDDVTVHRLIAAYPVLASGSLYSTIACRAVTVRAADGPRGEGVDPLRHVDGWLERCTLALQRRCRSAFHAISNCSARKEIIDRMGFLHNTSVVPSDALAAAVTPASTEVLVQLSRLGAMLTGYTTSSECPEETCDEPGPLPLSLAAGSDCCTPGWFTRRASSFYCPVERCRTVDPLLCSDTSRTVYNPARRLPCGHVVSHKAAVSIAATMRRGRQADAVTSSSPLKCPYCNGECTIGACTPLFWCY